jgi:hypothetical protein
MKQSGQIAKEAGYFVTRALSLLGTFSQVMITFALAPTNVNCLWAAAREWVNRVGYLLIGGWRGFWITRYEAG